MSKQLAIPMSLPTGSMDAYVSAAFQLPMLSAEEEHDLAVRLRDRMTIERYSHVQHIVSHVEGRLRADLDALDALRTCHPAGTVSGAPKIRAMQIIDACEPVRRGPYAGAVGYIDFGGAMDTCIALRTVVVTGGKAYVQSGAGIVADSVPENEYEETVNKAKGMLVAIAMTSARLKP